MPRPITDGQPDDVRTTGTLASTRADDTVAILDGARAALAVTYPAENAGRSAAAGR
ncbi:MAG: hypothetical protein ABSA03_00960 [Streptosporangiaceae bacterium]|jgi:hypothetical protein